MGQGQGVVVNNNSQTIPQQRQGSPMMTSASATQHQQQRQTVQEIIAVNVKALIDQLKQGKSETLTAYFSAMARFHSYSFGNILSIAHHRPDATHVAGFHTWISLGRHVVKGQKGIPIQAPMIGGKRDRDEKPGEVSEKPALRLIGFRTVYVFDVAQTEGEELPVPATVSGEVGGHRDRLVEFVAQQGIELEYSEGIAPAQGVSSGSKIVLLPGQTQAEEFTTLVHELAHSMMHFGERRTNTTKTTRETEAEAVAFIVGGAVGLNTGTASADYIGLYNGNAETLTESLAVIQQASSAIIDALFAEETDSLAEAC
jgi:hypothetical protein